MIKLTEIQIKGGSKNLVFAFEIYRIQIKNEDSKTAIHSFWNYP